MEWVLGITDAPPSNKRWKNQQQQQPSWEDEQLTATSSHTFHDVVAKICETALPKRRRADDAGIDDHLWNLKITSWDQAVEQQRTNNGGRDSYLERLMLELDDSDDENAEDPSDDDDDSETRYRGGLLVAPREHRAMYEDDVDDELYQWVPSDEKLSRALLPVGHVMHFTYDFGTTTDLYLKVLHVRRPAVAGVVRTLVHYFVADDDKAQTRDLEAVPAYQLAPLQRIDAHYPHVARAFLGLAPPLFEKDNATSNQDGNDEEEEDEDEDDDWPLTIGSATLGLLSRVGNESDTTFATMENADCSADVFFASQPFDDMNEFWDVAEQAWTPRPRRGCANDDDDDDDDDLQRYSETVRHVYPARGAQADKAYEYMLEYSKSEHSQYGPKILFFRLTEENKHKKRVDFDFAKVFPKTNAQLQSGKFRWIKYKHGTLRVLVGRGSGYDHRDFGSHQVLRTWSNRNFTSLHELLCAVEASWVYQKRELDADTVLPEFDSFLGPSNPGPKEPVVLGKEEDAVVVTQCSDTKKFVTALAIAEAEEDNGKTVLYSGHADGTLTKWCLEENKQLWSQQIYPDGIRDFPHYNRHIGISVGGTAGVAGLIVRQNGTGGHLLYTWTDAYDGYPEQDWEARGPSKVKCWSGNDGRFVRSYDCDVGQADGTGEPAYPSISTVVFCRLWMGDRNAWVDSMIVGLHCLCQTIVWKSDYSNYDIEKAQRMGEGNILPFYEHSPNQRAMETWRGHSGIIRAMAVIPDRYLLSYTMRYGHGLPDAMILWSLKDPGVPLCRHDFWDPSKSLFKQNRTRLHSVVGISASGTNILFASEDGDRVALVTVQNAHGAPCLELQGYGNIGNRHPEDENFHGNLAMSGKYAVMSNEGFCDAWLFNIEGSASHEKLDRREGNSRDFDDDDDDDDEEVSKYRFGGREIAVGKVSFPLFGGNPPRRKKRKIGFGTLRPGNESDSGSESDFGGALWTMSKDDGLGEGGPVSLAMHGKWLVAGFSNGSVVRAPYLPAQFHSVENGAGSGGLVSCSRLQSDEWSCPVLESNNIEDEEEENQAVREGEGGGCCIQ